MGRPATPLPGSSGSPSLRRRCPKMPKMPTPESGHSLCEEPRRVRPGRTAGLRAGRWDRLGPTARSGDPRRTVGPPVPQPPPRPLWLKNPPPPPAPTRPPPPPSPEWPAPFGGAPECPTSSRTARCDTIRRTGSSRGTEMGPRAAIGRRRCRADLATGPRLQAISSPSSSFRRRRTRDLAWRTPLGLRPSSAATSAGLRSSMATFQKARQVRSSNWQRT